MMAAPSATGWIPTGCTEGIARLGGADGCDGLGDRSPAELAEEHGVTAKHSLEGVCAREADVFNANESNASSLSRRATRASARTLE